MTNQRDRGASERVSKSVQLLVDACESDTVYGDIYLSRARELLGSVLTAKQYGALKRAERDIDEAVKQTRTATLLQDWRRVEALTAQVEGLRQTAQANAPLAALAAKVYDRAGVSIDPFSPGFESLPNHNRDLAQLRDTLVDGLKTLAGVDPQLAPFYDSRRAFFAGFGLLSRRGASKAETASTAGGAELQQLATQAAQAGDMAQLRRYAQALLAKEHDEKTAGSAPAAGEKPAFDRTMYQCPVDLAAPLPAGVAERAAALGLVPVRTEPLAQAAPLYDYVLANIWQANLAGSESEQEGTLRTEAAVAEAGFPKEVSEPITILIGQFLRNPFVNSGGARYLPQLSVEQVLIEDFPEDREPPAAGELLGALGLARRRGLARLEIDDALQLHGATVLRERLGLDPLEFRLVCMPQDLYMRVGRAHGWGQQEQWTHFDGYQVLKNGTLRALVGGDVRHGGLVDLLSIATTDQRDRVVARFAVVRRARLVARWH